MRPFRTIKSSRDRLKVTAVYLLLASNCLFAPAALAQDSVGTNTTSSPKLTRAEIQEFLLHAKVVEQKNLSKGITNSQRAVLDDGKLRHDAHIQTVDISKTSFQTTQGTEMNFRDCYKFNVAACELDKLLELNMVPVSVERKVGNMAAVTWWVDDAW